MGYPYSSPRLALFIYVPPYNLVCTSSFCAPTPQTDSSMCSTPLHTACPAHTCFTSPQESPVRFTPPQQRILSGSHLLRVSHLLSGVSCQLHTSSASPAGSHLLESPVHTCFTSPQSLLSGRPQRRTVWSREKRLRSAARAPCPAPLQRQAGTARLGSHPHCKEHPSLPLPPPRPQTVGCPAPGGLQRLAPLMPACPPAPRQRAGA
mmetsp:Transcript_38744/g.86168  ORF Transcript_38744/g.86168 Transcript_38744/m.86168 type:complete len:206 (+) Transcript_38744:466-1083(+)